MAVTRRRCKHGKLKRKTKGRVCKKRSRRSRRRRRRSTKSRRRRRRRRSSKKRRRSTKRRRRKHRAGHSKLKVKASYNMGGRKYGMGHLPLGPKPNRKYGMGHKKEGYKHCV